jgi:hypothetical protein
MYSARRTTLVNSQNGDAFRPFAGCSNAIGSQLPKGIHSPKLYSRDYDGRRATRRFFSRSHSLFAVVFWRVGMSAFLSRWINPSLSIEHG